MAGTVKRRSLRGGGLGTSEPRSGVVGLPQPLPGEALHEYVVRVDPALKLISQVEYGELHIHRERARQTQAVRESRSMSVAARRVEAIESRFIGGTLHLDLVPRDRREENIIRRERTVETVDVTLLSGPSARMTSRVTVDSYTRRGLMVDLDAGIYSRRAYLWALENYSVSGIANWVYTGQPYMELSDAALLHSGN